MKKGRINWKKVKSFTQDEIDKMAQEEMDALGIKPGKKKFLVIRMPKSPNTGWFAK